MIYVGGTQFFASDEYPEGSNEKKILDLMIGSEEIYRYSSKKQLDFELRLRNEIINAAKSLYKSGLKFKIFRESVCNADYWRRMDDGGFRLKEGVKPSDAVRDIFNNGSLYGTECATAMVILYLKAVLEVYDDAFFDEFFPSIYLMNWHRLPGRLREIGIMNRRRDYFPGDRRYFDNPDVDPLVPQWQGENVIDLGDGLYYGHGIGIQNAEGIIRALNLNRLESSGRSAFLMDSAARPNFKNLYDIYEGLSARAA